MTDLKQYRIKAASAAELVERHRGGRRRAASSRPASGCPSVRRLAAEVGLSPVTVAAGWPSCAAAAW